MGGRNHLDKTVEAQMELDNVLGGYVHANFRHSMLMARSRPTTSCKPSFGDSDDLEQMTFHRRDNKKEKLNKTILS